MGAMTESLSVCSQSIKPLQLMSDVGVSLVGKPGDLPWLCHLVQSNAHYTECKCEYSTTLSTVESTIVM